MSIIYFLVIKLSIWFLKHPHLYLCHYMKKSEWLKCLSIKKDSSLISWFVILISVEHKIQRLSKFRPLPYFFGLINFTAKDKYHYRQRCVWRETVKIDFGNYLSVPWTITSHIPNILYRKGYSIFCEKKLFKFR